MVNRNPTNLNTGRDGSISYEELSRIKQNIKSVRTEKQTATDLILEVSRIPMETRSSEQVHSRITDYFHRKGETSLNKW